MSNNKELTQLEREGLLAAGLPIDTPSQLSDAFRLGMVHLQKQNDELRAKLADIQSKWESASGDISTLFEIQPMNKDDGSYQVDGQCLNSLMKSIEIDSTAQSLADIRAEAVIEAADKVIRHNEYRFCIHCSLIDHANRIKEG